MDPRASSPGPQGPPGLWGGVRAGGSAIRWPDEDRNRDRLSSHPAAAAPADSRGGSRAQHSLVASVPATRRLPAAAGIAATTCGGSGSGAARSQLASLQDLLQPGQMISGEVAAPCPAQGITSSRPGSFVLEKQLHQGPRSAVWRATTSSGSGSGKEQQVVLKVLATSTEQQLAAAQRELACLQQLAAGPPATCTTTPHEAAAAAAGAPEASAAAGAAGTHLVQLLGSLLLHPDLAKPGSRAGAARGAGAAAGKQRSKQAVAAVGAAPAPGDAQDAGRSAGLVLVLSPLHQSLAWVLAWVHQRNGRSGLPPAAVRSLAHQLLCGLAVLHDGAGLVHRDVKPSNLLLQQPFVVRTGKKHLLRSMSLQELTSAQWALADLGSAGRLLPPAAVAAAAAAAAAAPQGLSPHSPAAMQPPLQPSSPQAQVVAVVPPASWLDQLWAGLTGGGARGRRQQQQQQQQGGRVAAAADTPSGQRWRVAPGDVPAYETAPYSPPEAILHLPAEASYDIWSAACCIYEAATGRVLFPVEAAAAARKAAAQNRQRQRPAAAAPRSSSSSSSSSEDGSDRSTQLDEVHLAMMRALAGRPPAELLQRSSVAQELYADTHTGKLWLSEEEDEEAAAAAEAGAAGGPWGSPMRRQQQQQWRQQFCKPLLHHLMARRTMSLDQALELAELLQPMLAWDPADRPTAAQLLQHKYFAPLRLQLQEGAAGAAVVS